MSNFSSGLDVQTQINKKADSYATLEQPSEKMSPANLKDCMEELLRFTLESHINETLQFDLLLSKAFCYNLLKDDPTDTNSSPIDSSLGVPSYPLYKRLASSLLESIDSKTFCRSHCNFMLIPEGSSFKQKEAEWQKIVFHKGSELVNLMKTAVHELHVQEPFFSQLKDGQKTIEGRCAVGDYNRIASGSLILFNKCVIFEVQVMYSGMLHSPICWVWRVLQKFFLELKPLKKVYKSTGDFTQKRRKGQMAFLQSMFQKWMFSHTFCWQPYFLYVFTCCHV
ncbi:hypothetical protein I3842_01G092200 [Carya illinoinensis]|uniref:ASCH domain-containing protein n=1 Tax=Carya illinoinensis TaxID=32201 RepID=A0A922K2V8_CARIL|nr:hypothetical protein I3842_01G092200 [Carya illinoinensis]